MIPITDLTEKQNKALDTLIAWSKKTTDEKLDSKIQELLEKYETYEGPHKGLLYWGLSSLYLEKEEREKANPSGPLFQKDFDSEKFLEELEADKKVRKDDFDAEEALKTLDKAGL